MTLKRLLLAAVAASSLCAQPLPKAARPEDAGFSSERLARFTPAFQQRVDQGAIPGAVVAVARNGQLVYFEAAGFQDRERRVPMKTDSIFRIYSMSKPITSVAVMMLAEEGKIDIAAPVSQYLPEFKDLTVGTEHAAPVRPMTVQDLLRHTSGLTYGVFGKSAVKELYNRANVGDRNQTLAEMVTKLAKLPLAHQPGSIWDYSMSVDVLGRIVEVASGMEFDRFVEERIARPLRMADTGFWVGKEKLARVAEPQVDPATGKRPGRIDVGLKPKWMSGGGGMVSTAGDYARFCQMLLNGGELDGVRLLAPKTIALMTSDHLPPGLPRDGDNTGDMAPTPEMGQSFGLGFAVRIDAGRNPLPGSVGDYFWAGAMGTYFWVDPREKLFGVLMVQIPFPQAGPYRRLLREMVYQALVR